MTFSLVICTYQRPEALQRLLHSVSAQTIYPAQLLIIDSSLDNRTKEIIGKSDFLNLEYFQVGENHRGLTRQRNFGVSKIRRESEIISFLDDDTIITPTYFEELLNTYKNHSEAVGVSGYIINENKWLKVSSEYKPASGEFVFDHWMRLEGSRFSLRRKFGLEPDLPPGFMPSFSHGYSSSFLPPSGRTYEVEMLMGGISSYKTVLFEKIEFSPFFQGYGLYEDADFSLRASRIGKLFVNTAARVEHHHEPEGRPNQFRYGRMVLRNGWYVWRVKNPNPSFKSILKWHATSLLLTLIRLGNGFKGPNKNAAFLEACGRFWGWGSLFFNKPFIQ